MKLKTKRQDDFIDVKMAIIEINGNVYRLTETNYGRLTVNKISLEGNDDDIRVHPRSGNEIDIS